MLERVGRLLDSQTTLVLATSNESAAPLFYYPDSDLSLYWLSSPDSRHSRDLAAVSQAAVAVFVPSTEWRDIRGVQMRGSCSVVRRPDILERYRERFRLGPEFDDRIDRTNLYCFRPRWLRYLDNSVQFGFRAELELR